MEPQHPDACFLSAPEPTPQREAYLAGQLEEDGYVMNAARVWAHVPEAHRLVAQLHAVAVEVGGLTLRQRGVLITSVAAALDDSYCALAWGKHLADEAGDDLAAAVLTGDLDALDETDRALARWARLATTAPNATTAADVQALRDVGFDDTQIVCITTYAAARRAFATVHDALGARPDPECAAAAPPAVRTAVTFGRPPMP